MFVFVLPGALFSFRLKTPAFATLSQFPPRLKASLLNPASVILTDAGSMTYSL